MRQLFVIGLLTMMKASNAIYRYDEEDYVPADVDGAVLMAASYTKGLPIEDPNVEKEHNHDHNDHEDEDMSVGNDEYFPIETNEIEEVYVSYPTKEDEWIKEWEVNENIPEDECVYTECTKGNYC